MAHLQSILFRIIRLLKKKLKIEPVSGSPLGMGNTVSRNRCLSLSDLPASEFQKLLNDSYTVQRTSKDPTDPRPGEPGFNGYEEDGWLIRDRCHSNRCRIGGWEAAHAYNSSETGKNWSFFMDNDCNKQNDLEILHACGWRPCNVNRRSFWPTRLKTIEERELWWKWLDGLMDTLQEKQLAEKN